MRRPFIVGNWKMNLSLGEAVALTDTIVSNTGGGRRTDIGVCPPFVYLPAIQKAVDGSNVILGAQNIHSEMNGAFTGDISGTMIKDVGCTHVIIGHSERRHVFGETDAFINAKLKTCFALDLTPIFCIGEKLEERESGKTRDVIESQLRLGLQEITADDAKDLVVAYEPVWAIGTGRTASPGQAAEAHTFIRSLLRGKFGEDVADAIVIQYGGSVKPNNIKDLLAQDDIDGALVGGASLEAESFLKMVEIAEGR